MKRFIRSQGFDIDLNIPYQGNISTIKQAENGKHSSGEMTRLFDINYFYITDLINEKEESIKYCSSNDMLADYHVPYAEIGASFNNSRFGLLLWGGCFVCCFELGCIQNIVSR